MNLELGTVTLLAVDQVGSTDQLRALGDIEGRDVRAKLLDQLLDLVADHHGTLVDTTGDGFLAHFRAVAQALAAGAAAMDAVAATNSRHGASHRCELRAGIHTGDPLIDDSGRLHGMAVVVATRLCSVAATGEVLVSPISRTLVAQRPEFDFGPARDLELKGVGEPVAAAPLRWEPVDPQPAASGLPPVDDTFGFVGRTTEAAALRDAIDASMAGTRHVVALAGEPGVGKTRLAIEALRYAATQGVLAGVGVCDVDLPEPYQPVADALQRILAQLPAPVQARLGDSHPLAGAVIAGRERVELPTGSVVERHRLFTDFADLITAVSSTAPVCVLFDDIQWATADTVALIRHLTRVSTSASLAIFITYRDSEVTQTHPLSGFLADLHRLPGTTQLRLTGLDADDVVALAEAAAGHALGEPERALAHRIHADSAGSPFFATELIRHLVETGTVVNVDGRWSVQNTDAVAELPASVRDVVLRRVSQLDEATQRLLGTASVIGFSFGVGLLACVADRDELDTLDRLETALAAGLVEELGADRFAFRHQLTRVSLYEQYSATRRALLHRRVGEALEAAGGDGVVEELAYHWGEATSLADSERVARYCRLAGDQARARHAPDDAKRLYERALLAYQLGTDADPGDRCDLLIALGQVQRSVGDGAARGTLEEAVKSARGLGDSERLGQAVQSMLRVGSFFSDAGSEDRALVALIDEVLPATGGAARARLLGARAAERHWVEDPAVLDAASAEAVQLARDAGDTVALAEVLLARCVALGGPDFTPERVALATEAIELAQCAASMELETVSRLAALSARYELGDAAVIEELPTVFALADQVTDEGTRWVLELFRACRITQQDPVAGDAAALAAYQVGEASNQPDAFVGYAVQLSAVYDHTGRLAEIVDEYAKAAHERPIAGLRSGYCRILLALDRVADARDELAWLVAHDFGDMRDMTWLGHMTDVGASVAALGTPEQQQRIYDWLAPFRGRFAFSVWFVINSGSVDRYLGLLAEALGDLGTAESHLRDAAALETTFGHTYWVKRSTADLARVMDRRSAEAAR